MKDVKSLDGTWRFELDPQDVGRTEEWFTREFSDTVELPGTTDENKKGRETKIRNHDRLTRKFRYEGAAWYQRQITVPKQWSNSGVTLHLERTRGTDIWVGDTYLGGGESLSTPQQIELTEALTPGEQRLTIRVDNDPDRIGPPGVIHSHMATEHTQTNWNGIIGRIELRERPSVEIDQVHIQSAGSDAARVAVDLRNRNESSVRRRLDLSVAGRTDAQVDSAVKKLVSINPGTTTTEVMCDLSGIERWDEFDPTSTELTVRLVTEEGDLVDKRRVPVPHRTFDVEGTQFQINGRTTFLRGTVDCCVFPETGYAPLNVEAWRNHLETIQAYGLNHVRFHSWCPPEAAFVAADQLGIYIQPELPLWNGEDALGADEAYEYYAREAERILDAYGNHPSFVMFALGNELSGDPDKLSDLVDHCREHDSRRLYAQGSFNFIGERGYQENEDYWTTAIVPDEETPVEYEDEDNMPVRGSFASYERGHVMLDHPSTATDYADAIEDVDLPVISHEIGQYQVYPDYDELVKYDGVLEPRNLELAADHLEAHGLQDRDTTFQRDSGRLAVDCYREEIEAALRTPGFGGFQLLGLQDFPGQETALVGILDSFMDSKGLIDPAQWRSFCSSLVPLARMKSRTQRIDDPFETEVQVAQYEPTRIDNAIVRWELASNAETVDSGMFGAMDIPQGDVVDVGKIRAELNDVDAPVRLTLTVGVEEPEESGETRTIATNEYDVWAYPSSRRSISEKEEPLVRTAFDGTTREALQAGEDVLLLIGDPNQSVPGGYTPSFWSGYFKHNATPRTLGITCDPSHPLFDRFPTDSHAGPQWYDILRDSRPVRLDEAPRGYEPIVRVIDNLHRNNDLGLVFETAVDDGSLLVCAAQLDDHLDRPAVSGFLDSTLEYMRSEAFDPDQKLEKAVLGELLGE